MHRVWYEIDVEDKSTSAVPKQIQIGNRGVSHTVYSEEPIAWIHKWIPRRLTILVRRSSCTFHHPGLSKPTDGVRLES